MTEAARPKLPRSIWMLGFVSLFMDISSEMIHAVLPLFITVGLGAGAGALGIIEGAAESLALMSKVFSGVLSDWLRRRKLLALIGYGLSFASKPLFAGAAGLEAVVTARMLDRLGKGIRGAPRDALVAEIAPPDLRGAAYGLRQGLDTVGAFLGPLAAVAILAVWTDNYRLVFWVSMLPAFLSVTILFVAVHEPASRAGAESKIFTARQVFALGAPFRSLMLVSAFFALARFSEAFLILKGSAENLPHFLAPLILVLMNLMYALSAYPAGVLSDKRGRAFVLEGSLCFLIAADLVLGFLSGLAWFGVGLVLWGLHMGFSQGTLAAMVGDAVPRELRGTAFGVQNLLMGAMLLPASVLAGYLSEAFGPSAPFINGSVFAALSLASVVYFERERTSPGVS